MARKKINSITETKILIESQRKCALCVGLLGDYSEKHGQIAHLDKNNSNNNFENLCFLCLDHHSKYDSTTSQHKNYTINETKEYRNQLYKNLKKENYDKNTPEVLNPAKPIYLHFNGVNSFMRFNSELLSKKKGFLISTEFRVPNPNYAGILFNVMNIEKKIFIYLIYYSEKHPTKPNHLALNTIKNNEVINIFTFVDDFTKWTNIVFSFSSKKISLIVNNRESSQRNINLKNSFERIEIGGTVWDNKIGEYNKEKRQSNYSTSNFRDFKVLSKSELIGNLEFTYGKDYFNQITRNNDLNIYGGVVFVNTVNSSNSY